MDPLARIAREHGCAMVLIRHLNKTGDNPLHRGAGSTQFSAVARSHLLAGCDPDDPDKRAMVVVKSNIAPNGTAIGYRVGDLDFAWTGYTDLTAERLIASPTPAARSKPKLEVAVEFLPRLREASRSWR
jgi:hypothetical protein